MDLNRVHTRSCVNVTLRKIRLQLIRTVGFQPKSKMLISGAVPTIFDYTEPKTRLSQYGKRPAESPPLTPCILSSVKIRQHLKSVTILKYTVT